MKPQYGPDELRAIAWLLDAFNSAPIDSPVRNALVGKVALHDPDIGNLLGYLHPEGVGDETAWTFIPDTKEN